MMEINLIYSYLKNLMCLLVGTFSGMILLKLMQETNYETRQPKKEMKE